MGGRGGASGLTASKTIEVGATITVNGYKIKEGNVESPSGKSAYVNSYRELTDSERKAMKATLKKAGVEDPVVAGKLVMPRSVADAAIKQKKLENEALKKNVPGLDELISASGSDAMARRNFNRQFDSESGVVRGINAQKYQSVAKKYPTASAYLKAESYYLSSNSEKSAIGKWAMNKIASGQPASKVIKEMENKWKKKATSNPWN